MASSNRPGGVSSAEHRYPYGAMAAPAFSTPALTDSIPHALTGPGSYSAVGDVNPTNVWGQRQAVAQHPNNSYTKQPGAYFTDNNELMDAWAFSGANVVPVVLEIIHRYDRSLKKLAAPILKLFEKTSQKRVRIRRFDVNPLTAIVAPRFNTPVVTTTSFSEIAMANIGFVSGATATKDELRDPSAVRIVMMRIAECVFSFFRREFLLVFEALKTYFNTHDLINLAPPVQTNDPLAAISNVMRFTYSLMFSANRDAITCVHSILSACMRLTTIRDVAPVSFMMGSPTFPISAYGEEKRWDVAKYGPKIANLTLGEGNLTTILRNPDGSHVEYAAIPPCHVTQGTVPMNPLIRHVCFATGTIFPHDDVITHADPGNYRGNSSVEHMCYQTDVTKKHSSYQVYKAAGLLAVFPGGGIDDYVRDEMRFNAGMRHAFIRDCVVRYRARYGMNAIANDDELTGVMHAFTLRQYLELDLAWKNALERFRSVELKDGACCFARIAAYGNDAADPILFVNDGLGGALAHVGLFSLSKDDALRRGFQYFEALTNNCLNLCVASLGLNDQAIANLNEAAATARNARANDQDRRQHFSLWVHEVLSRPTTVAMLYDLPLASILTENVFHAFERSNVPFPFSVMLTRFGVIAEASDLILASTEGDGPIGYRKMEITNVSTERTLMGLETLKLEALGGAIVADPNRLVRVPAVEFHSIVKGGNAEFCEWHLDPLRAAGKDACVIPLTETERSNFTTHGVVPFVMPNATRQEKTAVHTKVFSVHKQLNYVEAKLIASCMMRANNVKVPPVHPFVVAEPARYSGLATSDMRNRVARATVFGPDAVPFTGFCAALGQYKTQPRPAATAY